MTKGLRLPAGIRGRKLSGSQERFVAALYAAREKVVSHEEIENVVLEGDVSSQSTLKLVHLTRQAIQGTGWEIESVYGRGYRMIWLRRESREMPEAMGVVRSLGSDLATMAANLEMLHETILAAFDLPAHLKVPPSVWTPEVDAALLGTKGITGKLKALGDDLGIPGEAMTARYRVVKKYSTEDGAFSLQSDGA